MTSSEDALTADRAVKNIGRMPSSPDFGAVRRAARRATVVPVWDELLLDRETPVSAFAKVAQEPFAFLLESAVGGEQWGRYTYVGTRPRRAWRFGLNWAQSWTPDSGWGERQPLPDGPIAALEAQVRAHRPAPVPPGLPPFWGGWVGYFGYDVVRTLERLPTPPPDPVGLPDAVWIETGPLLVFDNGRQRAWLLHAIDARDADEPELRRRWEAARADLAAMRRALDSALVLPPLPPLPRRVPRLPLRSRFPRAAFQEAVERALAYIRAGDIFQVVLSRRYEVPNPPAALAIYRYLRVLNPSPYLFLLHLDDLDLVGSSPEVLVRVEEDRVLVRPIAGTRPRGRTPAEDEALRAALEASAKEQAEHLMLLDLGRNDVGRVARYGTVRVPERAIVERYSHVQHLVSTVEGQLRPDLGALDAFRACFPAGTVSGAPKVRAMEIIDELEPVRRGPYAGAVGVIGWGGRRMDLAIVLRTVVRTPAVALIQAGAGIVADSDPAAEWEETRAKARAALRAVAAAQAAACPNLPRSIVL